MMKDTVYAKFIIAKSDSFLGNELLVKIHKLLKIITLSKSIPFQRKCISEVNKLFLW